MTQSQSTPIPFLDALKRIEALTQTIRTEGLDAFETIEGAYEEVRELRAVLSARVADMRRMTDGGSHVDTLHSCRRPDGGRIEVRP